MKRRRIGGLRTTLVLTLAGVLAAGMLLIAAVVLQVTGHLVSQEEGRFGQSVLTVAIAQMGPAYDPSLSPTNAANRAALERLTRGLVRLPDVAEVVVVGPSLRPVVTAPTSPAVLPPDPALGAAVHRGQASRRYGSDAQGRRRVYVYAPLRPGPRSPGAVRLALRPGTLRARVVQAQNLILFYLVFNVVVLLLVGAYLLDRWMIRPVRKLTEATERVSAGHLSAYVDVEGEDALGRLSKAFNTMVDRLALSHAEVERRIVELEALNRELKAVRDTVVRAEKLASVGTLAAGVAHEVGNPLAAILGYVEMLQVSADDEAEQDILRRVHKEVLRINEIIRNLLAYSRPSPEEACGSVAAAVEGVVALLRPQPHMREVDIETDVPAGLPAVALSEAKLQQVLLNLCLNAADAMPDGGSLRLGARASETAEGVEVVVADQGEGISSEALARVFDPFFTTKEPGEGTGLGLAIVDRIIQDHGGEIGVRSAPDRGTTFTLFLPAHRGDG